MVAKEGPKKFEGVNVKECLRFASENLGVPVERFKYTILEEKRGLFKKHAIISIDAIYDIEAIEGINNEDTIESYALQDGKNGTIEIRDGIIIIKNPCEGGKPAVISTTKDILITVNEEKIKLRTPVYEESKIETSFKQDVISLKENEAERHMNLRTSSNNMEAYVSIMYKPNITYKLKDTGAVNSITMEIDVKEKIMPPKFT
ncbi:MAG: hypothetical protein ACI8WT_003937, partial [Clostridium sp.]